MAKKKDMSNRFSDVLTTRPEVVDQSIEASEHTGISAPKHTGDSVRSTWVIKKTTKRALRRLVEQREDETGKKPTEGEIIDEAIALLVNALDKPSNA